MKALFSIMPVRVLVSESRAPGEYTLENHLASSSQAYEAAKMSPIPFVASAALFHLPILNQQDRLLQGGPNPPTRAFLYNTVTCLSRPADCIRPTMET